MNNEEIIFNDKYTKFAPLFKRIYFVYSNTGHISGPLISKKQAEGELDVMRDQFKGVASFYVGYLNISEEVWSLAEMWVRN